MAESKMIYQVKVHRGGVDGWGRDLSAHEAVIGTYRDKAVAEQRRDEYNARPSTGGLSSEKAFDVDRAYIVSHAIE